MNVAFSPTAQRRFEAMIAVAEGLTTPDGEAINALRFARKLATDAGFGSLLEAFRHAANTQLDLARIAQVEKEAYERGVEDGKEATPPWKDKSFTVTPLDDILGQPIPAQTGWKQAAMDVQQRPYLSAWEKGFLDSILKRSSLTPKQTAALAKICNAYGVHWNTP